MWSKRFKKLKADFPQHESDLRAAHTVTARCSVRGRVLPDFTTLPRAALGSMLPELLCSSAPALLLSSEPGGGHVTRGLPLLLRTISHAAPIHQPAAPPSLKSRCHPDGGTDSHCSLEQTLSVACMQTTKINNDDLTTIFTLPVGDFKHFSYSC